MGKKRTDKTKVLLLVACLALAGVVVWQQFSSIAKVAPPAPLQLTKPAAAANVSAAIPAVPPSGEPAALAPAVRSGNPETAAPKTPAPRREVRPAAPKVATPSRSNAPTAPAPAAVTASKPAPSPSAERRVADAATPGNEESDRAIQMARQGEYKQARELLESAMRNGGQASFTLIHDHSKGNFEKDPKASCVGPLTVSPTEIKFDGAGPGDNHHFAASWTEFLEAGSNRFFGSGIGGFHVTIKPEGKYQNINLAPKSKEKAEAKLIVDLLNASAKQRTDRSK